MNGTLGMPHTINLKILKCPYDPEAFISMNLTFLEQVYLER